MSRYFKHHKIDGKYRTSQVGKVRWFNDAFGYGFITHDDGQDVFVHYSEIKEADNFRRSLKKGQKVRYFVKLDDKGQLRAEEVTLP